MQELGRCSARFVISWANGGEASASCKRKLQAQAASASASEEAVSGQRRRSASSKRKRRGGQRRSVGARGARPGNYPALRKGKSVGARGARPGYNWPVSPDLPRRRSVRLPYYDYASYGWYYITICTDKFKHLFGSIESGQLRPSALGEIVARELDRSVELRKELRLDSLVIMTNHIHVVVVIEPSKPVDQLRNARDGSGKLVLLKAALGGQARSVSSFVGGFKAAVTAAARELYGEPDYVVWNRGFHEHVVRTEPALYAIRNYIVNNPRQWELDRYNQGRRPGKSSDDELDILLAADKPPAD